MKNKGASHFLPPPHVRNTKVVAKLQQRIASRAPLVERAAVNR